MRRLIILGLCAAAAACSRHDEVKLQQDVKAVGQDLAADTRKAVDSPQVKQAGEDLKSAGHKADIALQSAADKAKADATAPANTPAKPCMKRQRTDAGTRPRAPS